MSVFEKGSLCRSIAGHDKDTIYIVVNVGQQIMVCDGRYKKLENAKNKNPKHLILLDREDEELKEKFWSGKVRNEDIKYSIKNYLIHIKKSTGGK